MEFICSFWIPLSYLFILASSTTVNFNAFKVKFGKTYSNALEEHFHLGIFMDNLKTIEEHNTLNHQGKVSFKLGINQFADFQTNKEYHGKLKDVNESNRPNFQKVLAVNSTDVPDSIDYRYCCPVQVEDQGQCGSNWAFCVTDIMEVRTCLASGTLVSLSVQNLLDCSWDYGNEGCNGGYVDAGYEYIIDNKGIDTEASYPYEERVGICRYDPANIGAIAYSYVDTRADNFDELKYILATFGPVVTNVDASHASFQLYESGIYIAPTCGLPSIKDHCVLIVGYGTSDDGVDYLILRNNWGTTWGEQGYMYISANCSTVLDVSYPVVTP